MAQLVWGPEGWTEDELQLLGDLAGKKVLEFGCGGAHGARWVASHNAQVLGVDISHAMLDGGRALAPGLQVPLLQADAGRLPLADDCLDLAFSAYGAVPFVADSAALMRELARVLHPGGRLVFSTSHPLRWSLPDVPGSAGLTIQQSYFDRAPYVEADADGQASYVEHHRTLSERVRELLAAGFQLVDLLEPPWPARNEQTWGGWSPLRGRLVPGTLIVVATKI